MYVLRTEHYFTLGPAGPGHVDERQNIFRRIAWPKPRARCGCCCSRCGKKAVALKAKHAHASGVAQSSSATGPFPPNDWLNGGAPV